MSLSVILDVDGTLVDTNYHHAIAWYRAFRKHGFVLPLWQIHRHIGMGGDHLVAALIGEEAANERGEDIRSSEKEFYAELINEVELMDGSRELITDLKDRDHSVVLASSAKPDELDHYLDLLDVRDIVDAWTQSSDVDSTKPDPDLVTTALDKAGGGEAVMVGDSTFDCEAAERAGVKTVAVMTGGFAEQELREAGADPVFGSIQELRRRLDETPLR